MVTKANAPAKNVPYYTPAQNPPAGTPVNKSGLPTLFKPITIRSVTLNNRMVVSPMCTYSADDGHLTDWHLVHLGQFALHGAGLIFVEATAVQANGRISPEDSGIWADSHIAPLRRITDYIRSQGQHSAIQLAHAGRKASTLAPWIGGTKNKVLAGPEDGGWPDDTISASALPYAEGWPVPREMSKEEIKDLVKAFGDAAARAVKAGFDIIEIHGAHGYLLTQFLSPTTNKRTDEYGGNFENRIRLLTEIVAAVRSNVPSTMPVFLRISSTEWLDHITPHQPSWTVDDTIRLAKLLPGLGVDLLDASSGGNSPQQRLPLIATDDMKIDPYYQVDVAGEIREAVRAEGKELLIGAVGMIATSEMAKGLVQQNEEKETVEVEREGGVRTKADLVFAARQFLRQPNWVLQVADELNVPVKWAKQYERAPRKRKL